MSGKECVNWINFVCWWIESFQFVKWFMATKIDISNLSGIQFSTNNSSSLLHNLLEARYSDAVVLLRYQKKWIVNAAKFLTRKTTEHEISNLKQFRNSLGAYVWVLMAFNSIPGSGIFREARNRSNRGKIFFPGAQSSLDGASSHFIVTCLCVLLACENLSTIYVPFVSPPRFSCAILVKKVRLRHRRDSWIATVHEFTYCWRLFFRCRLSRKVMFGNNSERSWVSLRLRVMLLWETH